MQQNRIAKICRGIVLVLFLIATVGMSIYVLYNSYGEQKKDISKIYKKAIKNENSYTEWIENIIVSVEKNVDDSVWKREELSHIGSNVWYFLNHDINSKQVKLGEDQWLFYTTSTDGNPTEDYLGGTSYSDKVMKKTVKNLNKIQAICEEQGIQFVLLIPSNKEVIYSEKVTDIKQRSDMNRTDKLVDYIRDNSDIPVVYPKELCLQYKDEVQLYLKYDTHMNNAGGYLMYRAVMDALDKQDLAESIDWSQFEEAEYHSVFDLANMAGMSWKYKEDRQYFLNGVDYDVSYNDRFVHTMNPLANRSKKVMLIGDSFRGVIGPYFNYEFAETISIHRDDFRYEYVEQEKPDIIVLEYVERYVNLIHMLKFEQ